MLSIDFDYELDYNLVNIVTKDLVCSEHYPIFALIGLFGDNFVVKEVNMSLLKVNQK